MLTFTLQPPKAVVRLHLHTLLPWTLPAIATGFGMPWAPGPEACHALKAQPWSHCSSLHTGPITAHAHHLFPLQVQLPQSLPLPLPIAGPDWPPLDAPFWALNHTLSIQMASLGL